MIIVNIAILITLVSLLAKITDIHKKMGAGGTND